MYIGFASGVSDVDDFSNGRSVFVYTGYEISDEFSLEIAYYNSGEFENNNLNVDLSSQGAIIQLTNTIPVNERISLFGKVGVYIWDASFNSKVNLTNTLSAHGEDVHYTLGASLHFTTNHVLTFDYSLIGLDLGSTEMDLKTFSVGWKYTF